MKITFDIPEAVAAQVVEAMARNYDWAGYCTTTAQVTKEEFCGIACLKNCRDQLRSFVTSAAHRAGEAARKDIEAAFPEGV